MRILFRFGPVLGLALVLCFAALSGANTTNAADGDPLQPTIIAARTGACASINGAGDHANVGTGIAFNGTNLLISCWGDSSVAEINPLTGAQVGSLHIIAGATSLGALAYDGLNSVLYGCSGGNTVGTIVLGGTNTFTPIFNTALVDFTGLGGGFGSGCIDGLAYDGTGTPSLWASGDVSSTTEHYTLAGAPIMKFNNGLTPGNSGIAVGGANLYLANNGSSQIYTVNKTFTSSTLFASFPARLEDLECDSVTFAGAPKFKGAIWSIDAYDNRLNAWEIPLGLCAFGGGVTPVPTGPVGGIVDVVSTGGGSGNSMLLAIGGLLAVAMAGAAVFGFRRASLR